MKPKKTILIDGELHQKLKVHCAMNGHSINKFVEDLITEELFRDENIEK